MPWSPPSRPSTRVGVGEVDAVGLDRERAALGHRVAAVDRKVHQHLLDLAGIGSNSARSGVERGVGGCLCIDRRLRQDAREVHRERGTRAGRALDVDLAAGLLDDPVHRREAEPRAAGILLRGVEGLERVSEDLLRHADARVPDGDRREPARRYHQGVSRRRIEVDRARFEGDRPAARHGVAGVQHEIEDHLIELAAIRLDPAGVLAELQHQLQVGAQHVLEQRMRLTKGVVHVEHDRLHELAPAECEQLCGQRRRSVGGGGDHLDARSQLLVLEHQSAELDDRRQEVVEVMRAPAGELADRLRLLRLAKPLFRLGEGCLRLHPHLDVARTLEGGLALAGDRQARGGVVARKGDDPELVVQAKRDHDHLERFGARELRRRERARRKPDGREACAWLNHSPLDRIVVSRLVDAEQRIGDARIRERVGEDPPELGHVELRRGQQPAREGIHRAGDFCPSDDLLRDGAALALGDVAGIGGVAPARLALDEKGRHGEEGRRLDPVLELSEEGVDRDLCRGVDREVNGGQRRVCGECLEKVVEGDERDLLRDGQSELAETNACTASRMTVAREHGGELHAALDQAADRLAPVDLLVGGIDCESRVGDESEPPHGILVGCPPFGTVAGLAREERDPAVAVLGEMRNGELDASAVVRDDGRPVGAAREVHDRMPALLHASRVPYRLL
jgi:hypothetical protein